MTEEEFKSIKAGDKLVLTASGDFKAYPEGSTNIGYVPTTYGALSVEEIGNLELVKVDRTVPEYGTAFNVGDRVRIVPFKGMVFGCGVDLSPFDGKVGIVSRRNVIDRCSSMFLSEVYVDVGEVKDLTVAPCCLEPAGDRYLVRREADGFEVVDNDSCSMGQVCFFSRNLPDAHGMAIEACKKLNGVSEFGKEYEGMEKDGH